MLLSLIGIPSISYDQVKDERNVQTKATPQTERHKELFIFLERGMSILLVKELTISDRKKVVSHIIELRGVLGWRDSSSTYNL